MQPRAAYVLHELLASDTDLLRQCCTEHHDLLVVGCRAENLLNIAAHVCVYHLWVRMMR